MGVAERRLREKEQRRFSIIDAAEQVFFAKGIESATMDEVADTAELSKGLLYFYFKSKNDLAHSIVHRGLRTLTQFFQEVLDENDTGIEQVMGMGYAYIRFSQERANYFNLMSWFNANPHAHDDVTPDSYMEACHAEGDRAIELVAKAVQNGIDDGTIRDDLDPAETAVMLWAQTHGLVNIISFKEMKDRHMVEPEQLLDSTFRFIKEGLRPR